jgi:hypothetical protein
MINGQQVYDMLFGLIRDTYESVQAQDYDDLISYVKSQQDNSVWSQQSRQEWLTEIGDAKGEQLRERVLSDLSNLIGRESKTTPERIEQMLSTYPILQYYLQHEVLSRLIQERFNKDMLISKFRENPSVLFDNSTDGSSNDNADESSSSSSSGSGSSDVPQEQQHVATTQEASTDGKFPLVMQDVEHQSTEKNAKPDEDVDNTENDESLSESESDEGDECDEPIIWFLFSQIAAALLEAYITVPTGRVQDTCHYADL